MIGGFSLGLSNSKKSKKNTKSSKKYSKTKKHENNKKKLKTKKNRKYSFKTKKASGLKGGSTYHLDLNNKVGGLAIVVPGTGDCNGIYHK